MARLYSSPPSATPFSEAKPQLLVAWWITLFSTCIILLRLSGRYVRVEKLFIEDRVVAVALLPLYLRMACIHLVFVYGTNNVDLDGIDLSGQDVRRRVIGSRLVLASRIFYAATLWVLKFATVEFLARLGGSARKERYTRITTGLRWALGASFLAVVVSDLAECRPASHYWQVVPDPGPQCRQGMAQLLTMGISSAAVDVVLVIFPIPMIVRSRIAPKRKLLLVLLFSFGFLTVGVTLYRVARIVQRHGDQVVRSTWASVDILATTAVANVVAVGSFLRDTGVKKVRYRPGGDYGQSSSAAADGSRRWTMGTTATATATATTTAAAAVEWEAALQSRYSRASHQAQSKTAAAAWARDMDSTEGDDDDDGAGGDGVRREPSKASTTATGGNRPVSPAESSSSLIHPYQRASRASAVDAGDQFGDPHLLRPPSPVVQAPLRR
ncbi:integral membrane protein, partial [Geosmithia morbida]